MGLNEAYTYIHPPFSHFLSKRALPYDEFHHVNEAISLPSSSPRSLALAWALLLGTRTIDILGSRGQLPVARPERPERGNSVKREWCAVGRQRRRTIRHGPLPLHSREVWPCRCIWTVVRSHLVAEPYHPPGRHPSTLARSSAAHPAGVITPLTPRPLDLPLSRCFSL